MKLLIVLTSLILTMAAQALNEKSYIPPPRCKDDLAYNFCLPDCLENGKKIEACFESCGKWAQRGTGVTIGKRLIL